MLAGPVLDTGELSIRGRKAKTAADQRDRRRGRVSRNAFGEIRATRLTLRPPWRPDRVLAPVEVNVVGGREPAPPAGEAAIEWLLITTLPIGTTDQGKAVVGHDCVRWCIEVLFRTLKSACRIEERRFEDIKRVLPCLGLLLIVAWRTLLVCRLGRECPEVDCEVVFEPSESRGEGPPERHVGRVHRAAEERGRAANAVDRPPAEARPGLGVGRLRPRQ